MLTSSARRAGAGGIVDKMIPGYKEKIWARLPIGYKTWKVNSENSAITTHVANHKRYQNLILRWKENIEKGLKPSPKHRISKVPWRLQIERGTMHWGRWYEGPYGSDYRPGNTFDRLTNARAPFTEAEWQERKAYRSYDLMKFGYGLLGIFLLYRVTGEWPVVWCEERAPEEDAIAK
jgi:ubiquinol-cytochrome c reductase cytochrome c1 subunit